MKKVVKLTERDLTNIIKKVILEDDSPKGKGKDLITLLDLQLLLIGLLINLVSTGDGKKSKKGDAEVVDLASMSKYKKLILF